MPQDTKNKPFKGVIKLDVRDSKADWTPYERGPHASRVRKLPVRRR